MVIEMEEKSDEEFRSFYENLPLSFQSLDVAGRIIEVNPHWLYVLGYSRQEVIGTPFSQYIHPDDNDLLTDQLSELARIKSISNVELRLQKKNGESVYVSIDGVVRKNNHGEFENISCFLHDITKHKKLEEAKHRTRDVWARTFDAIDDIVTIQDKDLTIIRANKAAHRFFQLNNGELIGRHCYEVFAGKTEPCEKCPLLVTLKDRNPHTAIIKHETLNKIFRVSSSFIPSDSGGEGYLVHVASDITKSVESENVLRESEEKFSLAFDASPDSININRLEDGLYIDVNRGFIELTGFTREDVIGKMSSEINIWHNPADRQRLTESLKARGYCQNLEAQFCRKDGSITTALMSARIIMLNNVPHILSLARDIGKIKETESEIVTQKLLFESMFNAISDGVVLTDINRTIVLANRGMENTFGYVPDELIGKTSKILYSDIKAFQTMGKNIFTDKSGHSEQRYNVDYRHKSGKVFCGETFGVRLYDQNKKWIGNLGIIRDISQQLEDQAEHDRLIAAIEQVSDAIVITDLMGNIQYANPAFEDVTGYSLSEVMGQNPRILKSDEQDASFYRSLWQTITHGRTFQGRMVNKRKNGELFTEETTISPVCDAGGEITNFVAVKRDITKQLLLENQLHQSQKMEAVGRLSGGIAHDFNNILGVIIGYTELAIVDTDPKVPLHDNLKKILNAAERSANLIRQLLAFSRQQPIAPKILNLNDAIEVMLKMLQRLIGEDINLLWVPQLDLPLIKIDPTQIDQILANLCVNAKDSIRGGGRITIETTTATFDVKYCATHVGFKCGSFVQLSVSDNGTGIDKETQKKIFEPFFSTKELGRGTGLGLSTVYGIVKQNSAFINVYSEPNVGTTFKLYFPVCNDNSQPATEQPPTQAQEGRGETVLAVEDEAAILTMITEVLTRLGYNLLTARTPQSALEISEKYPDTIDLLLTDVVLPEMTGKDLAHQIQTQRPCLRILFMSGYTANVIVHNGILDEGINFIQKPFTIGDLTSKIRKVLTKG